MKIGCDIDGVLGDILTPLAVRMKRDFGVDLQPEKLEKFDLGETLKANGIKSTWLFKTYNDEWFWSEVVPMGENIAKLNEWSTQGHEIHLITGRNKNFSIPTVAWLNKNKIARHALEFSNVMKKYEYLLKSNIDIFIEDRFFEADKAASYGIASFVVRRTYNVEYESRIHNSLLRYVDDLSGIDPFIERYQEYVL